MYWLTIKEDQKLYKSLIKNNKKCGSGTETLAEGADDERDGETGGGVRPDPGRSDNTAGLHGGYAEHFFNGDNILS